MRMVYSVGHVCNKHNKPTCGWRACRWRAHPGYTQEAVKLVGKFYEGYPDYKIHLRKLKSRIRKL